MGSIPGKCPLWSGRDRFNQLCKLAVSGYLQGEFSSRNAEVSHWKEGTGSRFAYFMTCIFHFHSMTWIFHFHSNKMNNYCWSRQEASPKGGDGPGEDPNGSNPKTPKPHQDYPEHSKAGHLHKLQRFLLPAQGKGSAWDVPPVSMNSQAANRSRISQRAARAGQRSTEPRPGEAGVKCRFLG